MARERPLPQPPPWRPAGRSAPGIEPADRNAAVPQPQSAGRFRGDLPAATSSGWTARRSRPWRSTSTDGGGRGHVPRRALPGAVHQRRVVPRRARASSPAGGRSRPTLLVDRLQQAPGPGASTDHPIFRVFAGQRNSFLSTVTVERYFAVPKDWKPAADSTTRVIARLRNGAPLAVERRFGQGRVVAFLTTAAPVWNNWARNNPSFVVAMQELQAYLAARESARPAGWSGRRCGSSSIRRNTSRRCVSSRPRKTPRRRLPPTPCPPPSDGWPASLPETEVGRRLRGPTVQGRRRPGNPPLCGQRGCRGGRSPRDLARPTRYPPGGRALRLCPGGQLPGRLKTPSPGSI